MPMPPSIKVFGILQIVFGSMGCVCGGTGAGLVLLMMTNEEFAYEFEQGLTASHAEGYTTLLVITSVITLLLSVFQIITGVGLLKKRNWGRTGSLLYAVVTMLVSITSTILTISMIKEGPNVAFTLISTIGGAMFNLIYPICILIFLTRPVVVGGLAKQVMPHLGRCAVSSNFCANGTATVSRWQPAPRGHRKTQD